VKNNLKIFIQARVDSKRLPGKIFFTFFGELIIDRIIRIAKKISPNKNIFLLTGNYKNNFFLKKIANKNKINFYSGSETNVLKRFCDLIVKKNFLDSVILRITADNYLAQPKLLKLMINDFFKLNVEYSYISPLSHYAGELFKGKILIKNFRTKYSKMAKEHVTWDLRNKMKIKKKVYDSRFFNISHKKSITLDTIEDLKKLKWIELNYLKTKNLNCLKYLENIKKYLKI
jgi:spore coat polysaccharide biosynthesis protein SpsF